MFRWQSMFKICDVHNKVPCHSSQRNLIYIPPLYIHQYGVSSAPIFWSYSKIRKWERQKKLWAKAHYTQASATTHRNHYAHYFIWGCVTHISISGGCSVECVFSPDDYTVSIFYYFSGDFFSCVRRATQYDEQLLCRWFLLRALCSSWVYKLAVCELWYFRKRKMIYSSIYIHIE